MDDARCTDGWGRPRRICFKEISRKFWMVSLNPSMLMKPNILNLQYLFLSIPSTHPSLYCSLCQLVFLLRCLNFNYFDPCDLHESWEVQVVDSEGWVLTWAIIHCITIPSTFSITTTLIVGDILLNLYAILPFRSQLAWILYICHGSCLIRWKV